MPWLMFINPWLLWGLALVGVPVVIHLLTRRRHKRVMWAAMDFLLEADKQTRKRVRLENILLLLLRCLVVMLIVLLVSRPWWEPRGAGALAEGVLGGEAREYVLVLDDSPSMGVKQGAGTTFAQMVRGVREFLNELAEGGGGRGDVVTLLRTSRMDEPMVNRQGVSRSKVEEWSAMLEGLEPGDMPARWEQVLGQVKTIMSGESGGLARQVYLLTDLREGDWRLGGESDATGGGVGVLLRDISRLAERTIVLMQGEEHPDNLAVTQVAVTDRHVTAGVDTRVQVKVTNYGRAAVGQVPVTLQVNGAAGQRAVIERLGVGEAVTLPMRVIFAEAGNYQVQAQISSDNLPGDNVGRLAAWVKPGVSVLVVQGQGLGSGGVSDTFFLERALQPRGAVNSGNVVRVVTESRLEAMDLGAYDVVILANLMRVGERQVEALEKWVKAGGLLVGFAGDQVEAAVYNQWLHREGQGLLPGRLTEARGDTSKERFWGLELAEPGHELLRVFTGSQNPFLNQVKVFRHWGLAMAEGATGVLLSLQEAERSAVLVEKRFGEGRAVWWMVGADTRWSNWPGDASFVVLMLEMVRAYARGAEDGMNLRVGELLEYRLNASRYRPETSVTGPDGAVVRVPGVPGGAEGDEDATALWVRLAATQRQGFYDLALTELDGQVVTKSYAVNLPGDEGNLRRVELQSLQSAAGDGVVMEEGRPRVGGAVTTAGRVELWRGLVLMLLVTLMVEQWLAWSIGRRR